MSTPISFRWRGFWAAVAVATLALSPLGGCSSDDGGDSGPTDPFPSGGGIEGPNAAQLTLDLPVSLAIPAQAQPMAAEMPPACADESFPGRAFACVTRYLVGQMAIPMAAMVQDAVEQVVEPLSRAPIPEGFPASFTEQGVRLDIVWNRVGSSRTFALDFFDAGSGIQLASWDWTLGEDGSANGRFDMLGAFLGLEGASDVPRGLSVQFDSNADGTDKQLIIDIDAGDTPSSTDMNAPTRLHLVADRSASGWAVRYAMFHPSWLYDEVAQQGVETFILVNATGGLAATDPAAMRVIALPGAMTTVPPSPDQDWSICQYVFDVQSNAGLTPGFSCGDNNPFYVLADGSVQEGGAVPAGFDAVAAAVTSLSYAADDLTQIRQLTIGFD